MKKDSLGYRPLLYYLFSIVVISVYGGQVCPFLENVGVFMLGCILLGYLVVCWPVRLWSLKRYVYSRPPLDRAVNQFFVELAIFILLGLLVTAHNSMLYEFPVSSGIKLCVGCLTLGFFFAIDLSIVREHILLLDAIQRRQEIVPEGSFVRITTKFVVLSLSTIFLISLVLSLIIIHDISWISEQPPEYINEAKKVVLIEIFLVGAVLIGLMMNLILSYSKNLRLFFEAEQQVLNDVAKGNFTGMVPVGTRDELGLIAKHTNSMIHGLRKMTEAKDLLGKFVSEGVAQRILDDPEGAIELGGSLRNLAILLSDIRGFTDRTERDKPEQVVSDLNLYFSEMVKIVHQHQGVVDKFIGDGLLAIFGLEDSEPASRCAVNAALAMLGAVEKLNTRLSAPIEIGIGISRGDVVVGNIGSAERLEFTAIGNAVNTAARLEASTKELNVSLVVSEIVYEELYPQYKELLWKRFDNRLLKGKAQGVTVYGLTEIPQGLLQRRG